MKLVAAAVVLGAIALCLTAAMLFRWDCDAVALTSGAGNGRWLGDLGTGVREPGARELAGRWDGEMNLDFGSRETVVCVDRWSGEVGYWDREHGWTKASDLAARTPAPTPTRFIPLQTPTPGIGGSANASSLKPRSEGDRTFTLDGKKYRLTPDGRREPVE